MHDSWKHPYTQRILPVLREVLQYKIIECWTITLRPPKYQDQIEECVVHMIPEHRYEFIKGELKRHTHLKDIIMIYCVHLQSLFQLTHLYHLQKNESTLQK